MQTRAHYIAANASETINANFHCHFLDYLLRI